MMNTMSQFYGVPNIDPNKASDAGLVAIHTDRQGNLIVENANNNKAVAGKMFVANFGSVTTPLATAATTAITARRPMAWIRVPAETGIIPVRTTIVVESAGATTQGEISVCQASNDVGDGTSTASVLGARQLNTRLGTTAGDCTPRHLSTGDCTLEVDLRELDRFSFAASAVNQKFVYRPQNDGLFSVLHGDASWLVYIGGNAVNFFGQMVWIETNVDLLV